MIVKKSISVVILALLGLGLVGCATGPGDNALNSKPGPGIPVDLTGEWEQSNDPGNNGSQLATIENDTISIYWLSKDGTKSLYWAGNSAGTENSSNRFSWDSVNDSKRTRAALLASNAESKSFTYENGIISYEVGALGKTWTVKLKQTSTTPAKAPEGSLGAQSNFEVEILNATFDTGFQDQAAIIVSFTFTNNSERETSFFNGLRAKAFQNGVELSDMVVGLDSVDTSLTMANIKPGVTLTVQQSYALRDDSDVLIEVKEFMDFSDTILASKEFVVSK